MAEATKWVLLWRGKPKSASGGVIRFTCLFEGLIADNNTAPKRGDTLAIILGTADVLIDNPVTMAFEPEAVLVQHEPHWSRKRERATVVFEASEKNA